MKRNKARFPKDFLLQLTEEEKVKVVAFCDHLAKLKYSSTHPYAFTEHGAIMVASILNSERAVEMSIFVVRVFIKLREMMATHKNLSKKLNDMEKKHDAQFRTVFEAIRRLMSEPEKPRRPIGFQVDKKS